jgi:hypothetical protein
MTVVSAHPNSPWSLGLCPYVHRPRDLSRGRAQQQLHGAMTVDLEAATRWLDTSSPGRFLGSSFDHQR